MVDLQQKEIDEARQRGYRPVVVFCLIHNRKILLVYKSKHRLWYLPQGGIENKESMFVAFLREMSEELGKNFRIKDDGVIFLGSDKVLFPTKTQNTRELKTDSGQEVEMIGKKYFFIAAEANFSTVDIKKTEFDDYRWLSYGEAMKLAEEIYQSGKRRITIKALDLLKNKNLIA